MQSNTKALIHLEDDGSQTIDVRIDGTGVALVAMLVSIMEDNDDFRQIVKHAVFCQEKFTNDLSSAFKNTKTYLS